MFSHHTFSYFDLFCLLLSLFSFPNTGEFLYTNQKVQGCTFINSNRFGRPLAHTHLTWKLYTTVQNNFSLTQPLTQTTVTDSFIQATCIKCWGFACKTRVAQRVAAGISNAGMPMPPDSHSLSHTIEGNFHWACGRRDNAATRSLRRASCLIWFSVGVIDRRPFTMSLVLPK